MRLTNSNYTKIIPGIYYFSTVLFFLIIILNTQFENQLFQNRITLYVALGCILTIQLYIYFIWKYVEYDGGGEVLVLVNRGVILSKFFNYRTHTVEINRYQLHSYKIYNFIVYKRLIVYHYKNKRKYKNHINITFVSPRKIKYLSQSLNKIIANNKQQA